MERKDIARSLQAMADWIEVSSGAGHRARSFRAGARALESLAGELDDWMEAGRLEDVRGIGETIAREIRELYQHGDSVRRRELSQSIPAGVRDMLRVPGLGPKKVRTIWQDGGVGSIESLLAACEEGRIAELPGFGAKTQDRIRQQAEYLRSVEGLWLRPDAELVERLVLEALEAAGGVDRVETAGEYRRWGEVVSGLVILVQTSRPRVVGETLRALDGLRAAEVREGEEWVGRFPVGPPVRVRAASAEDWGEALLHATGSEQHLAGLERRARALGLRWPGGGAPGAGRGGAPLDRSSEQAVYDALGLPWIPPELRESGREIEVAEAGRLPDLVRARDLRGVVHLHTRYSDGGASIAEMAGAARSRGYSYLGVTDHSQSAFYAGGLREEDVRRQHEEIDRLNAEMGGFRIFKGIESDIRPDGTLDYPEEVLDRFDFVIASVHSAMHQPRGDMTARVLRALRDPHTTFLGHPTGRLLLQRPAVDLDMDAVIREAARQGVAVEINANPRRLDLDWRMGEAARRHDLLTSIHPDAHVPAGIDDVRFGVGIARKAGFEASRVVNALSAEGFDEFVRRRRNRPRG